MIAVEPRKARGTTHRTERRLPHDGTRPTQLPDRNVRSCRNGAAGRFLLKTADNPDGIDRSVFEKIRTAMAKDRPRWLAEGTPPFFGGPGAVPEERMRWGVSQGLQTSLLAALEFHRAFTETDFRAELQAIEVPTLVIHGDRDTSAPLEMTGHKTAARIPGARLEVYEGAAHGLPITHTDRLNADLVAFARDRR